MKTRMSPRWLAVSSVFFLAACAGFVARFAPTRDHIRVPHERHAKAEVDCGACHETIFDATSLDTQNLPKEKKCLECHKDEKKSGNCGFCHTNPDKPETFPKYERHLVMNHQAHMERVKEDCTVCHVSLPAPYRTDEMAPPMDRCLACHEHEQHYDNGKCSQCHVDLQAFPLKPVSLYSHRGDFLKKHQNEARSGTQACGTCHEQSFCADCHGKTVDQKPERLWSERIDRAFIHRADFLGRHPIEARADQSLCLRCHGTSFCSDCHRSQGLTSGAERPLNPHPAGFAIGKTHGQAARRDITSCAACHDQGAASTCVSCHKVGGVGGNPHEPAWLLKHAHSEIPGNLMCQVCHPN